MQTQPTTEIMMLSRATGVPQRTCKAWMQAEGLIAVTDLMTRYPGINCAEAMTFAACEIEYFVLGYSPEWE